MDYTRFIAQLDELLDTYHEICRKSAHRDLSDLPAVDQQGLVTRSLSAIARIVGPKSAYGMQAERLLQKPTALHIYIHDMMGVVQALRDDLKAGSLQTLAEVVHGEVFSNFLDMARYLNDSGYKDAAAVIAGSTLESHLRELAIKNAIPVVDANGSPAKADRLNADLAKAAVYSVLD